MQIKNPTNQNIHNVRILGTSYSIDAESTLDNVPEEHARYWQETLHKFLILRKDKLEEVKKLEVEEIPTPKAPVVEEVEETEISGEGVVTEEDVVVSEVTEVKVVSKGKGKGKK